MADSFAMPTVANAKPAEARARAEANAVVVDGTALTIPFTVKVACPVDSAAKAKELVAAHFDAADREFSPFNDASALRQFAVAPVGEARPCSDSFAAVLSLSTALHTWSSGAFDPVAAATAGKCNWKSAVQASGQTVTRLHADAKLDLSAVSKGWCVDRMAETLATTLAAVPLVDSATGDATALPGAYVDWGGDIRAVGCHPATKPWTVALPLHASLKGAVGADGKPVVAASLELVSAGCCTSGSYLGVRPGTTAADATSHLHDTNSNGNGSNSNGDARELLSVTVIHTSCAVADAMATVIGAKRTVGAARAFLSSVALDEATMDRLGRAGVPPVPGSAASSQHRHKLYRIVACVKPDGALVDLLPTSAASLPRMPRVAARTLVDELRASVRGRVLNHVALVANVGGGRFFGVSASSFCPLLGASAKPPAPGTVVARVAAIRDSRLAALVKGEAKDGRVVVIAAAHDGEHESSAALRFVASCKAGRLLTQDEYDAEVVAAILNVRGAPAATLEWAHDAVVDAGDHIVGFLRATGASSPATGAGAAVTKLETRRGNGAFTVAINRAAAKAIAEAPGPLLPLASLTAVVSAWVPSVRGLLVTTVQGVELTSRDPPLITFDVKTKSKVDELVFGGDAQHHRLHLFDGGAKGAGQEETFVDWFDDGANADPAMQFMYVQGAPTSEEGARTFRFDGVSTGKGYPLVSLDGASIRVVSNGGGDAKRSLVIATPTAVDGAPAENYVPAGPASFVARLMRFAVVA